tara:strand:+ start:363 stop:848 length:486 start_codon:yes stop_codon:yes gene_type:complete
LAVDRYLKAPGRGAHMCYSASCIESVQNSKLLSRAFKKSVPAVDVERLREDILASIDARITDLLRIGRRAGWTVSGTDTLLRSSSRLKLLILATDAADDSKRKLLNAVIEGLCVVVTYGVADHLGRTQKKENRVAIGVSDSTMAARLKLEIERRSQVLVAT